MSRFSMVSHGRNIVAAWVKNILIGLNIEGSTYYSNNPVDTDLSHLGNDGTYGILTLPSAAEIPAANLNSQGQVLSLPGSDTSWTVSFQPPEHAGNVTVTWAPASSISAVSWTNATQVSLDLVNGVAVVTPAYSQPSSNGWGPKFTPTGTPMTSLTAIPVGQSAGLTSNFLAQVNQLTSAGATLRALDRVSANDNQGYYRWQESNSRVLRPTTNIITAATRTTLNSPDWTPNAGVVAADNYTGRKIDGEPWENQIARSNTTGRPAYRNLPWNAEQAYYEGFADYVCAHANNTVYVEVANEVWNTTFAVNVQARQEARGNLNFCDTGTYPTSHTPSTLIDNTSDPQSLTTTDPITSVAIYDGLAGAGERYCEKVIQVSKWIKARCVANGKPNAIKIVFAWQNTSATTIANLLDYVPNKNGVATLDGTATKANVDFVSSAPYFYQSTLPTNTTPDLNQLAEVCKDNIDSVTDIAKAIAAVATARGLGYISYEAGQSLGWDTLAIQQTVQRCSQMYDLYMYYWDRLNHKLPSGSIVNHYANSAGLSNQFGWGLIEQSTDMEQTASWLTTNRPKAAATRDWIAGNIKLQPALIGSMFAATGSTVGTIVGTLKRRTFGSIVTISSTPSGAFAFVDSTAEILQVKVADATAFASAGSISYSVVESHPNAASSVTTSGSCAVISTPIWSVAKSSSAFTISNNGLTGNLVTNAGVDNLLICNQSATALDKWFDVTVDNLQGNMSFGLCAANSANNGVQPYVHYYKGGTLVGPTGTNLLSGIATFTTGDKLRFRVKNNNVVYVAKWNGTAWVWQNSANPDTDTGGVTVSGLDNTFVPCADVAGSNGQFTADFTGW